MPKVLVVEDDVATRRGLETLLQQAGYDVLLADSVPQGRKVLDEGAPDLLITDVRLGEFNGLQLLATSSRPIPAIVATAFADPALEIESARLGARYLVKPIIPAVLLALMEQLLSEKR
jgi:DNA-binding response OmpR family regulator